MAEPVIVVVEDDDDTREYMEMLLSGEGYHPVGLATTSGAAAMIRQVQAALVILDLELERPDSGLTLLRRLRADPVTAAIPAIMYSAHEHALRSYREELQALDSAMLPKPFSPDALLRLIETILASPTDTASPSSC